MNSIAAYIFIYISILFWGFVFGLLIKSKKLFIVGCSFSLLFLSAFRGLSVGKDTISYNNIFLMYKDYSLKEIFQNIFIRTQRGGIESGYLLLNKLVGIFSDNSQSIIFVTSFLFILGMALFIYYNSNRVFTSVMIFLCLGLYLESFNIVRQCIAIVLVCNILTSLKYHRKVLAVLLGVTAVLFHETAIIGILPLFLLKLKPSKTLFSICSGMVFLIGVFYNSILNIFISLFPKYSYLLDRAGSNAFGIKFVWLIEIIAVFIAIYLLKWDENNKKEIYVMGLMVILSIVLSYLGTYNIMFDRVSYYFSVYFIVFLPKVISNIKLIKPIRPIIYMVIHLCMFGYFLLSVSSPQYAYSLFWN